MSDSESSSSSTSSTSSKTSNSSTSSNSKNITKEEDQTNQKYTIECKEQVMDINFDENGEYLSIGFVSGRVGCWKLGDDAAEQVFVEKIHKKPVRGVVWFENDIISISKDESMARISKHGKIIQKKEKAHSCPLTSITSLEPNFIATADDEGRIRLWNGKFEMIKEWKEHDDYVTDLLWIPHKKTLIAAGWNSGDGYLSVYDIKKLKFLARSDNMEDELLSLSLVKYGKKLIVGTLSGVLLIWSWGYWGDVSDRFPGHPQSIDSIVKVDEDNVITGSSDGILRLVGILPNRLVDVIGVHPEEFPVERVRIFGQLVASSSHNGIVRIWSLEKLYEDSEESGSGSDDDSDEDSDSDDDSDKDDTKKSDSESSSSSDSDVKQPPQKKKKGQTKVEDIQRATFFQDL